ncbi:hypothetical protein [Pseudomarimonas salicorniae]|uniref:Uncharacterized protein n=1 Tax=Pseudomarimonas salicorniae TaxID=2933270 RepID=A0ABT0GJA0_9GAMM|nr:hypothetical protein [Lysobacter sp. CAU 1642]MCK7594090.1 hypothetical protein [Lysobacter sp. CAU 1642]
MLREMILFSLVFACQILVVSYYLPKLMLSRVRRVMENYPPASYPKLYPQSIERYGIGLSVFAWAHRVVLMLGLLTLAAVLFWVDHASFASDGHISEAWPAAFGMIQFLPWMLLEITGYRQFKLMREANASSPRRAELRPRRLLDAISPWLLLATALMGLGAIAFDFYVHDLDFSLDRDSTQRAIMLVLTNGFMLALSAWLFYGRKLDPHQSAADRWRQSKVQLKSMAFVSMAMSVFFFTRAAGDVTDIAYLDAPLMSLYFLAIALLSLGYSLNRLKPENLDLEVYRSDAVGSQGDALPR